jgi:hypothetical protein
VSPPVPNKPKVHKQGVEKVAIAITILQDGGFEDGAAVLAYSVFKHARNAKFRFSLVAFVHAFVKEARVSLTKLGYRVIMVPTPVNYTSIPDPTTKEAVKTSGCCGDSELIKLAAYRLTEFDRVVHVDADTYFLQDFSQLLELDYSLLYTTDPSMVPPNTPMLKQPVQGGFMAVQPSEEDYTRIVGLYQTEKFSGNGWGNSGLGYYWGGPTIQGILPYYYERVAKPNRRKDLNRCVFNNMFDTEACRAVDFKSVVSVHFTSCPKPWTCNIPGHSFCISPIKTWFEYRKEAEAFYQIPSPDTPPCATGSYRPMQLGSARRPSPEAEKSYYDAVLVDVLHPLPGTGGYLTQDYVHELGGLIGREREKKLGKGGK